MRDFHDPHIGLGRIYTKTGDQGETGLVGGQRVPKDDVRLRAYGAVDELNAVVGLCREELAGTGPVARMKDVLLRVQHQLFNLGSQLSTLPGEMADGQPQVLQEHVRWLEEEMDACNKEIAPLRSFVLPGGSRLNALLHLARTVCRRAERDLVTLWRADGCGSLELQYLNRLSDAFFVWSRWTAQALGHDEVLWAPNES